ncbi:MAG: ubiquinol-cytochrome C chaperone [Alphaproteobacteria bacterium]|nr:ubiquinol-cytochrome C chaperone [Alphaproteobacteria bacterium]MBL7099995.1 ubiquinol-cytochrome C chaperone [Alphaproteobacteria bacterium]
MLNILRRQSPDARLARTLYEEINAAARRPVFFQALGVDDTVDGRFDVLALHAWLALGRLNAAGMGAVARKLTDTIFTGFDEALRDLGNGDMGMGPRMKKLGLAFNGRMHAYEAAKSEGELAEAILRNVYRGRKDMARNAKILARYALSARESLKLSNPANGTLDFGTLNPTSA